MEIKAEMNNDCDSCDWFTNATFTFEHVEKMSNTGSLNLIVGLLILKSDLIESGWQKNKIESDY